ncbi:hypothetical protein [Yoonia maricola]|uniref:hypothetical protein n=1 Tax=Yoonia maricola TaxID=420999 RepID=UPI000C23B2CE|nr:hypothetical protein [Yoonia maricola]
MFDGELIPLLTMLAMSATTGAMFYFNYCDVTVRFDRRADQISVTRWSMRDRSEEHFALSDMTDISFETAFDNDVGKVVVSFIDASGPTMLAALRHLPIRRHDGTIKLLVKDMRDWAGLAA